MEESSYDDSLEGIVVADLRVRSDGETDRIFEVRLIELADAWKTLLFKCLLQEGQHSEPLWDTGEYVGMRSLSFGRLVVELPIGIGPIDVSTGRASDFVLLRYKDALAALLVHAGART